MMTKKEASEIINTISQKMQRLKGNDTAKAIHSGCCERLRFISAYCFDDDDKVPGMLEAAAQKDLEQFMAKEPGAL